MASDRLWGNTNKKIILLDSNAIMMLFEFSIDLEDELTKLFGDYRIVIPEPIRKELEFLAKSGKGKQKRLAKPSLKLINKYDLVKVDSELKGDDALLFLGKKLNGFVLTNDRILIKRLKDESIHSICLRGKKQLMVI